MRAATVGLLTVLLAACESPRRNHTATLQKTDAATRMTAVSPTGQLSSSDRAYSEIVVHNVILHESSSLKLKLRWLRGRLYRTRAAVTPSLDQPDSFSIDVLDGSIAASLTDLSRALNEQVLKDSPLRGITLSQEGKQLKLTGTLHKIVPLPIEMLADVGPSPDHDHVRIHIVRLSVLKIPAKGLFDRLKVGAGELVNSAKTKGISIQGDDVDITTAEILPPPHNTGKLSDVHLTKTGELVEIFGNAHEEAGKVKEWRNFIRLRGGTIGLGKLTMDHSDILIVDTSQADWFNLDLARYPEQIVNGTVRITPEAGLQIFAPDITKVPQTPANRRIDLEWIKNRNASPPPIP